MGEDRIQHIEEAQAFSDRRVDDLDAAIREIGRRVLLLVDRFDRLEAKFEALDAASGLNSGLEDRPPPHSGRLPGGR